MKSFLFATLMLASQAFGAHTWIATGTGHVGADPVSAGNVIGAGEFMVCRAQTPYGTLPGHLVWGQSACYVTLGEGNIAYYQYEVLQGSAQYKWVDRDEVSYDSQLVYVGTQNNTGEPNYVCKRPDGWVGRLQGGLAGGCWIGWGAKGRAHLSDYEVLVPVQQ